MNIKELLLSTNMIEDNDYLNKYVSLINSNIDTKHISFKTQKHHVLPRCYFKLTNKPCDDSKDNVVYLLYKDHVLAHYYLALCSKDNEFKYNNICALKYCLNHRDYKKQEFYKDERHIIEKLDYLQELYEESKIIGSVKSSLKQKGKTRKNKGTKHINKDGVYKMVSQEDLEKYLSQGWKLGARPLSIKHRKALLNANLGKHRSEECKEKLHNKFFGIKISQERKDKIGFESKDRVWINNGISNKFVKKEVVSDYLKKGFVYGRLKLKEYRRRK